MNDPAYNQGLIEDYGHLKKIDGEVGVIGGSGMLEWAGAGGIAGSVKSAVSGVKHAVKVYKMIKAAKAAKKAEAAAKAAKSTTSAGKYLSNSWHKGTFPNKMQSVKYHLGKHGAGRTATQYTKDAQSFFQANKHLGKEVILKDGTHGIKIQTKQIINGKTHRVGGYWTKDRRIVTFWD